MTTITGQKVTWEYIINPKLADLKELKEKYNLDSFILEELLIPTFRPKAEKINNILFLALHFPIYNDRKEVGESKEIDFIIGENFIISSSYTVLPPLKELLDDIKKDAQKKDDLLNKDSFQSLHVMIAKFLDFVIREMRYIEKDLSDLSSILFTNKNAELIRKISSVRNNIINFRHIIKPQKEILESLLNFVSNSLNDKMFFSFNKLLSEYLQICRQIEMQFETINALYDTHMALISLSTNKLMLIFAVISGILVPLSLVQIYIYISRAAGINSPLVELLVAVDLLLLYALIFLRVKRSH